MSKRFSSSLGFRMKEGKFSCGYCLDIIHPLSKNPSAEIEGKDRDLAAPTRCDGCEATASLVTRMMSDLGWARWNRGHWTIQVKRKDPERGRATLVACGRDAWGMVLHTFETYTDESREAYPWAILGLESKEAFDEIGSQIANCVDNHRECHGNKSVPLPTRVLDVETLRLYEPAYHERGRYCSLSHCWGKNPIIQTLRSSVSAHIRRGVPWEKLSRTFQEAVMVTRELGIRYLWIDSLGIIQDDSDDWEREAGLMADVYSNAYITIAATASADGNGGLFRPHMEWEDENTGLRARWIDGHDDHVVDSSVPQLVNKRAIYEPLPLLGRGWCLQERMLSSRVLHFRHNSVTLECKAGGFCECGETGFFKIKQIAFVQRTRPYLFGAWTSLMREYSTLALTKSSDKLVAIMGLARTVGRLYGLDDTDYVAGMWRQTITMELLWFTQTPGATLAAEYRAPSWSWAALDVPVLWFCPLMNSNDLTWYYTVSQVHCKRAGNDPLGPVRSGELHLHCHLQAIDMENGSALAHCLASGSSQTPYVQYFFDIDPRVSGVCSDGPVYSVLLMHDRSSHARRSYHLLVQEMDDRRGQAVFQRVGIMSLSEAGPPHRVGSEYYTHIVLI